MESLKQLLEHNRYFIYGIVGGIVITFFDKDKLTIRTGVKLFVFGVLNDFTRRLLSGYQGFGKVDILDDNQLMVASVSLSIFIYFFLIYIGDKTNRDKIIEAIIARIVIKK